MKLKNDQILHNVVGKHGRSLNGYVENFSPKALKIRLGSQVPSITEN